MVTVTIYSSCGQHAIAVQYRIVDEHAFSRAELSVIQTIADDSTREVRRLLPGLPDSPVLEVFPDEDVIEELGYKSETAGHAVYWGVDPHFGKGIAAMAKRHLRPVLFQTFFRMVRAQSLGYGRSLPDHMINSGLETVFARDFAATTYPWSTYPPEVADWANELLTSPEGEHHPWMSRHPDGRRWIGIRAGTYLVDRAVQASGQSVVDLVSTPTDEILRMAMGAQP